MYVLDRPLIPKYTRAKLTSDSVVAPSSTTTSRSSSGVSSQLNASGRSFNFGNDTDHLDDSGIGQTGFAAAAAAAAGAAAAPPSTATTRVLSSTSLQQSVGRPYSTADDDRRCSGSRRPSNASSVAGAVGPAGANGRRPGPAASWAKKQLMQQPKGAGKKKKATTTSSGDSTNTRQWSADSGIEEEEDSIDAKFILPPRITTYVE